jgi:hypothetical protein
MIYPSGADYVEALQHPRICFREEALKTAVVEHDTHGRPRPISGALASVFSLVTGSDNKRYAIKCFTREVPDQNVRYPAISQHLARISAPWKVHFEYQPTGVLVKGSWYPILKMEWVSGTSLIPWIERHNKDREAVLMLAHGFADLIAGLARQGIAHGDLQHGNVLVTPEDSLRLVDYDGMFVSQLAGRKAAERGHRNYQPPGRSIEFDLTIDRFSSWVIYLSLMAIAQEPDLWTQYHERDGEYLLLAEEDYKEPLSSERFAALTSISTPEIRELATKVRELAGSPVDAIPPLVPIDLAAIRAPMTEASPDKRTGHPAWMVGHLSPNLATSAPNLSASPAASPVRFSGRGAVASTLAIGLPLLMVLSVVLSSIGGLPAATVGVLGSFVLVIWVAVLGLLYRQRAEVAAQRPLRAELAEAKKLYVDEQRAARELAHDLERLSKGDDKRDKDCKKAKDDLHNQHRREITRIDKELQTTLSRLKGEQAKLADAQARELADALRRIQEAYTAARLATRRIADARLDGFGKKIIADLRDRGVTTAADFRGFRMVQASRFERALIILSSGAEIYVPNVGRVKAGRLEDWRKDQRRQIEANAPRALPYAERVAIINRYTRRAQELAADEQQSHTTAQKRKVALGGQLGGGLAQLTQTQQQENVRSAQQRAALLQRKSSTDKKLPIYCARVRLAATQIESYKNINFGRFVMFLLIGRDS